MVVIIVYFFKATGPISTSLDTKYFGEVLSNCTNERPVPHQREDKFNKKIVKIELDVKKIFSSRATVLVLTKLGTKHP